MSAKQVFEMSKKEDTGKSKSYVEGEYLGSGLKKAGEWIGNTWNDFKQSASDFFNGISYATTGKNVQSNVNSVKRDVKNAMVKFDDYIEEKTGNDIKGHLSSVGDSLGFTTTPQTGASAKPIVYSNWSPAAQQFGMDQSTAYAEHMANTAHQREVADLRAAGLNPVLGAGSGASGVSGHVATSGSSAQKSLNGDAIVDAIGATAAVVTAILTKNPAYGYMAGNAVNSVGDMVISSKK